MFCKASWSESNRREGSQRTCTFGRSQHGAAVISSWWLPQSLIRGNNPAFVDDGGCGKTQTQPERERTEARSVRLLFDIISERQGAPECPLREKLVNIFSINSHFCVNRSPQPSYLLCFCLSWRVGDKLFQTVQTSWRPDSDSTLWAALYVISKLKARFLLFSPQWLP